MKRAALCLLAVSGALLSRSTVRAEDRVTIRGAYYREPSTRVIQPVVDITKDLPHGFDINAHYLVDTITSASAAAGTTVDSIFTEIRSEVGLGIGKTWDRTRATLSYKYSGESDYWSHAFWTSLSHTFWGNTATVGAFGGFSLDSVGFRAPDAGLSLRRRIFPARSTPCSAASGYTQVLSPVAVAQINLDAADLWGFLSNPYRPVPNGPDEVPHQRLRTAVSVRGAYYFPEIETGLQIQYRYYRDFYPDALPPGVTADPWGLSAHTIEGRIYHQLSRDLEVRFLYRQYFQQPPAFWCDLPSNAGCGPMSIPVSSSYASSDPAIGPVRTEYPEVKLIWDADAPADSIPFFRWFAAGTFEISYGRYFQNNSFGDAHVLQTGYSMPY